MNTTTNKPIFGMRKASQDMRTIRGFLGDRQAQAIADGCRGEERQFFYEKLDELARIVKAMPKNYETDGQGDDAIAHLHYFTAEWDWYITEKDGDPDGQGQIQAYGMVDGWERERGYVSIKEITRAGAEVDLHWEPRSLRQVIEGNRGAA